MVLRHLRALILIHHCIVGLGDRAMVAKNFFVASAVLPPLLIYGKILIRHCSSASSLKNSPNIVFSTWEENKRDKKYYCCIVGLLMQRI